MLDARDTDGRREGKNLALIPLFKSESSSYISHNATCRIFLLDAQLLNSEVQEDKTSVWLSSLAHNIQETLLRFTFKVLLKDRDVSKSSHELLKSFFLAFLLMSVPRGLVGYMFLGRVLMLRDERLYADMEPGENEWLRAAGTEERLSK